MYDLLCINPAVTRATDEEGTRNCAGIWITLSTKQLNLMAFYFGMPIGFALEFQDGISPTTCLLQAPLWKSLLETGDDGTISFQG